MKLTGKQNENAKLDADMILNDDDLDQAAGGKKAAGADKHKRMDNMVKRVATPRERIVKEPTRC